MSIQYVASLTQIRGTVFIGNSCVNKENKKKKREVNATKWVQMFIIRLKKKTQLTVEGNLLSISWKQNLEP